MKKIFLLFAFTLVFISCKNSEENNSDNSNTEAVESTSENGEERVYSGEFIYMADAAVLKGKDFIYGVKLDDMASKLGEQVAPVKKEEFDMVPVTVKGIVSPKPEDQEGWPEILTITSIVMVGTKPAKADIKFEEKKS